MNQTTTDAYVRISEAAFYDLLEDFDKKGVLDKFTFISQQGFIVIRYYDFGLIIDDREEPQVSEEMQNQWLEKVKGDKYDE